MYACRRIQKNTYLSPYTKLNSKWIKDNIKPDTLNLIEEKEKNSLELIGTGKLYEQNTISTGTKTDN